MLYVVLGCVLAGFFWWIVQRASERARADLQRQIDRLSVAIRKLPTQSTSAPDEPNNDRNVAAGTPDVTEQTTGILPTSESVAATGSDHARIEEAVSARLGRKVVVRSVREIENADPAGNWATQGWITVQSSHNQLARRE